jgi:hypothetical protein
MAGVGTHSEGVPTPTVPGLTFSDEYQHLDALAMAVNPS